ETDADAAVVFDEELGDEGVVGDLDRLERADARPQQPRDLASRGVARVQYAAHAVRGLASAGQLAVGVAIEARAPVEQLLHVRRPFLDEHAHGVLVAEAVAGLDGVGGVERGTVVAAERDGNAALGVAGVAFGGFALRENQDAADGREGNRRAQPGDAAADDHEIGRQIHEVLSYHPVLIRIDVPTPSRSYAVHLEDGILDRVGALLDELKLPARRFVVSSPLVWRLHGQRLSRGAKKVEPILVPDGERAKQLPTVTRIYDALVKATADRSSTLITFGGGVIGDMAGYAASTYLRGIPLVHIPTTLLAQVDSSIGGKVGVNHPQGKNLIGSFFQPHAVLIDPSVLGTLPRREFRAGLYEVI